MPQAAPTGTATVLLGDVAGSTRLWQAHPDAMTVASRRLAELLDELVDAHGGHRPREQGEGDNLVAVFGAAADAAACALALDHALTNEAWPGDLDIAMRLGLHTGDVVHDEHTGYLGPTFNRCARLRDLGHAHMILLSQATRDIIADALPMAATIEDLGSHQLRDLSRTEHVFLLRVVGDERTHAPLKSVSSLPNNLPVPVTSLVGRDAEVRSVAELFRTNRLVTLTGAGGSGKTRLAQHVAAALLAYAPDGAWWVDLMPVADDAQVPIAIAEAIGLTEVFDITMLANAVADRQLMLVLDNCEHVIDAVADTVEALLTCANVRVLATSRETLDIDGEHTVRVRPLGVPPEGWAGTAAELVDHDATRLFVERASSAEPFEPTGDDPATIATICRRLDGIPLAIELAAARTRLLSVADISQGLDDRFTMLGATGRRQRASRQRTLEASVTWSYDLLHEDEQALLCRLSVFPGAFDLDGAADVGTLGAGGRANLDLLSSLVDKSLVTVRPAEDGRRYRLLETIRQYALDRLAERDEAAAARDAHLAWCVAATTALVADLGARLSDPDQADDILAWSDDVRAAEQWALRCGRPGDVITMRWAFYGAAPAHDRIGEWLRSVAPLLEDERLTDIDRGRAEAIVGGLVSVAGAAVEGRSIAARAVERLERVGKPFEIVAARFSHIWHYGLIDGTGGDDAVRVFEVIVALHPGTAAVTAPVVAGVLLNNDRWQDADDIARQGVAVARDRGLRWQELFSMSMACTSANALGRVPEGAELARAAHLGMRDDAPALLPIHASANGIWSQVAFGATEHAEELVADAIAVAGPIGSLSLAYARLGDACMALQTSDWDRLARATTDAMTRLAQTTQHFYTIAALSGRSIAHTGHGEHAEALRLLERAEALVPADRWMYARGWTTLARVRLAVAADDLVGAVTAIGAWAGPTIGTQTVTGWRPAMVATMVELLVVLGHPDAALLHASIEADCRRMGATGSQEGGWAFALGLAPELPSVDGIADDVRLTPEASLHRMVAIAAELAGRTNGDRVASG